MLNFSICFSQYEADLERRSHCCHWSSQETDKSIAGNIGDFPQNNVSPAGFEITTLRVRLCSHRHIVQTFQNISRGCELSCHGCIHLMWLS